MHISGAAVQVDILSGEQVRGTVTLALEASMITKGAHPTCGRMLRAVQLFVIMHLSPRYTALWGCVPACPQSMACMHAINGHGPHDTNAWLCRTDWLRPAGLAER